MAKKRAARSSAASRPRMDPAALTPDDLATLLTHAGGREITPENIREDLAAGAPQNADGTLHLVHYTAWLASQVD